MAEPKPTDTKSPEAKINEKKWSKALMDSGYTVLPNIIIEHQRDLGINSTELNIILYLASRWWNADGKPFPSKTTMAASIGLEPRTIQRNIANLQSRGLIRREERRNTSTGSRSNIYHLDGLIKAAKPYAIAKQKERELAAEAKAKKATKSGKAKLSLVVVNPKEDEF
jgi:DNA-binding transcriptional regulator YhcF (GntR family)